MTFISYAQNFEDVMLWRALKHVGSGFYIDVGANDPTLYSVTRAFYDHGWQGINLEPVTQFFEKLQHERPRDINLQLAVGAQQGTLPFYDIPDSGLATTNADVAQMHRSDGWEVREIDVDIVPLREICERHVASDIHFLKIDVEGAERDVLLGMDFRRWRPWIVVVEATIPMSQQTAHESWETLLLDAGYEYAYFDGLNRYYVAKEHAELKPSFALPPNVFDGFVLNTNQESWLRADEAEARSAEARTRALEAETKLARAHSMIQQAEARVADIYASTSWKVTRPLRLVGRLSRRIRTKLGHARPSPRAFLIRLTMAVLRRTRPVVQTHPVLGALARRLHRHFPDTFERIRRRLNAPAANAAASDADALLLQEEVPAWGAPSRADNYVTALTKQLDNHPEIKG
jgi:FkbM family methyltransferase